MEAQKRTLKHQWVPAHQLLSTETGDYPVCKRCGFVQNEKNKDKPCVDKRLSKGIHGILRKEQGILRKEQEQMNAKEARATATKRATEIENARQEKERREAEASAQKWREEKANWEKNQIRWITERIAEAVSKGQHSTSFQMEANDDEERSGEKWFWQVTPYKAEMKRVMKHFEDLGYTLEFYVKNRENVDLSDLNPRDNWITYETRLKVSW